jgi:glycosyltransferase involved in cell wall biosynthesis
MLIGGCVPSLKQAQGVPLLVTLQGDDIFLEGLPEPYRTQALNRIRELVAHVDEFIVFCRYYEGFMGRYFGIPPEKFHRVPLGIDTQRFGSTTAAAGGGDGRGGHRPPRPATIGYLARLAPEKGLHLLVEAFLRLRERAGLGDARLHIAGWLGREHHRYAEAQFARLREAGLAGAYRYEGAIDGQRKAAFLQELDVLSVPTTYREPKGLYVLEALASGVPVVQPEHGAFPEMLAATGGGLLVPPEDPAALAAALERLLRDEPLRRRLGAEGQRAVQTRFAADAMGRAMLDIYRQSVGSVVGGL